MATRQYNIATRDGYQKVYGTNYEAQTFTVVDSHRIMAVLLMVGETSAANLDLEVAIQGVDANGKPDGTDLISSTMVTAPEYGGSGGTTGEWIEVSFGEGVILSADTVYAIVLRMVADAGHITTDYWGWQDDGSSPGYTTGSRFYSANSGTTWTEDTTHDFMFAERDGRRLHENHQGVLTGAGLNLDDTNWGSQTFTPAESYTLYSIAMPMFRGAGDTPGALTVEIYLADVTTHKPTGSALATGTVGATTMDALGTAAASATWVEAILTTPLDVTIATDYCIVVQLADAGVAETAYWVYNSSARTDIYGAYSSDSGSNWTIHPTSGNHYYRLYGASFTSPQSSQYVTTRILAAVGNEIWVGSTAEALSRLAASIGEIDTTKDLHMFELLGKAFIANDTNLKVIDFVNVKITTNGAIGTHPPDFGTVLTGGTSGAQMVVDYIDALTGSSVAIYGKLITTATFEAETVTGIDDDSNVISFTGTAQTTGPFVYDWTVYGNSTTYGVMPSQATLGCAWRGRPCLSGDKDYPQYWYKGRQANPWDWNYVSLDSQSPVASDNADAGQTGEPIIAIIPYSKDKFIYGCTNSIWYLNGDPADGASLLILDDSAGFVAADAWCWDKLGDLYIVGTTGILKIPNGFGKPENITAESYPDFLKDLDYDSQLHILSCGYDRLKDGFKICKTTLATGANTNWWFDIRKKGLFKDTYPTTSGVYCQYWYEARDPDYRCLLHGCADGFIRWEDSTKTNDDTTASTQLIDSYISFGPFAMGKENEEGVLNSIVGITTGSRAGTALTDSSALTCKVWTGLAADDIVEKLKLNTLPTLACTIAAPGRNRGGSIKRPVRGVYAGLRIGNSTASQTWGLEELILNGIPGGKV